MLSKKDFVKVADILKRHAASEGMVDDFCFLFQADNPRFKPHVFKKACGVKGAGDCVSLSDLDEELSKFP